VKVSRNGPERRSGKRIVAGTALRLEFQVLYTNMLAICFCSTQVFCHVVINKTFCRRM